MNESTHRFSASVESVLSEIGLPVHRLSVDAAIPELNAWLMAHQPADEQPASPLYRRAIEARAELKSLDERNSAYEALVPVPASTLERLEAAAALSRVPRTQTTTRADAIAESRQRHRRSTLIPLGVVASVLTFLWLNEERLRDLTGSSDYFDLAYVGSLLLLGVFWLIGWRRQARFETWLRVVFEQTNQEGAFGEWYDGGSDWVSLEELGWVIDSDAESEVWSMAMHRWPRALWRLYREIHPHNYDDPSPYRRSQGHLLIASARQTLERLEDDGVVRREWDRGSHTYRILQPRVVESPPPGSTGTEDGA